ncbi:MAG: glycosyltransferase [Flavobacteriaceae bacterium]|nr:glycosyltransferase [Flavobacteriaceae bacterium]
MKIVHILEDFSLKSGGIRTVVKDLHSKLIDSGIESYIVTNDCETDDDVIKIDGDNRPWKYSKRLSGTLMNIHLKKSIDIIHIHGVWMYPQYKSAKYAIENNISFIVSPHGMYEPWLWTKGTIKKKIYFKYLAKPAFSKATYLHAITPDEAFELNRLFSKSKIAQIPNLIDVQIEETEASPPKEKYILYLGRLDSKKGVDILIKAFKNINSSGLKLYIAGAFNEYKIQLEALADKLGVGGDIKFLGLITGEEKKNVYKNAYIFVAPSHSEVIGMVNLEAAIQKTPVITTHQTGIHKDWSNNGGILINPRVEELTDALKKSLCWTDAVREKNGERLQRFVIENYSWKNRFKDWDNLYKSML